MIRICIFCLCLPWLHIWIRIFYLKYFFRYFRFIDIKVLVECCSFNNNKKVNQCVRHVQMRIVLLLWTHSHIRGFTLCCSRSRQRKPGQTAQKGRVRKTFTVWRFIDKYQISLFLPYCFTLCIVLKQRRTKSMQRHDVLQRRHDTLYTSCIYWVVSSYHASIVVKLWSIAANFAFSFLSVILN